MLSQLFLEKKRMILQDDCKCSKKAIRKSENNMKVLQINTVYPQGSTGKIAEGIHNLCIVQGLECMTAYRYEDSDISPLDSITVSSYLDCHIHNRLARWTMYQGCFSYWKTRKFLRWVKKYDPDVVHLHNIHGSFINHKLLFCYLKKYSPKVIWTLHDCWTITGGFAHYDMVGCTKWKTMCSSCLQKTGFWDSSTLMHKCKKKWFSGISNMTLVANSEWTAEQAKASYMKQYPVKVIYNGIDLSVFRPTKSDFRQKYGLEDKKIVLGVAFGWNMRKGLDVFIELSKRLSDDYKIVLVGTNEQVDQLLTDNILSIHRTQNQHELAEIYTAADVFVNPTREEAFGLVNIEALACGTPGVTFRTGGSPECYDATCGVVVEKNDIIAMEREIRYICEKKPYSVSDCRCFVEKYDMYDCYQKYIDLYKEDKV